MSTASNTPINDAERAKRKEAINFARGSVRFEGIMLSEAIERLNQRFVDGEPGFDSSRLQIPLRPNEIKDLAVFLAEYCNGAIVVFNCWFYLLKI